MASTGDKITDTRNAARPNSARVTSGRSSAGTTLACDNLAGWPTASKVHFVTYTVDSNSNPVAGSQLDCYGIVSGNNINSFTVVDGNDTGNSVGDYVEMLPTAAWGQDLADALIASHNRDGTLKDGAVSSAAILASNVVTTAKILDDAVTSGKVVGLDKSNLTTESNPYKFRVSRNAAANTGNGAFAVVAFDTEQYDTNNNVAAGVYTIPTDGFYQFNWHVTMNCTGTNTLLASLFKNGTEISDGSELTSVNALFGSSGSDLVQCTAGDTIDIRAFGTATQSLSVGNIYNNYFSGFRESIT